MLYDTINHAVVFFFFCLTEPTGRKLHAEDFSEDITPQMMQEASFQVDVSALLCKIVASHLSRFELSDPNGALELFQKIQLRYAAFGCIRDGVVSDSHTVLWVF